MPDTMIERVAKALALADNGAPTTWKLYADDARVAITAMRDFPDQLGNHLPAGYKPGSHSAREIWNSVVDAALGEKG